MNTCVHVYLCKYKIRLTCTYGSASGLCLLLCLSAVCQYHNLKYHRFLISLNRASPCDFLFKIVMVFLDLFTLLCELRILLLSSTENSVDILIGIT